MPPPNFQKVPNVHAANVQAVQAAMRNHKEQKIAKEERKEKLRRILESRKAKSANDQENVQSPATEDNINETSIDAKKAE